MFNCKTCEALKEENQYLKTLIDQLLTQIAPKIDPVETGLLNVEPEEELDDEGKPIVRDRIGI